MTFSPISPTSAAGTNASEERDEQAPTSSLRPEPVDHRAEAVPVEDEHGEDRAALDRDLVAT